MILMAGLGLGVGLVLLLASRKLAVKENPLIEDLVEILPGSNCGACGFAGCRGLAEAFAADPDLEAFCPVGGDEAEERIVGVIGVVVIWVRKVIGVEVKSIKRKSVSIPITTTATGEW